MINDRRDSTSIEMLRRIVAIPGKSLLRLNNALRLLAVNLVLNNFRLFSILLKLLLIKTGLK
jgi:hypothetical protein